MKYRKKPVVIEAVKFTGENHSEVLQFIYPNLTKDALAGLSVMKPPVIIETLEGSMTASAGDYIIKGIKGEFYPCKPDIFEPSYELVLEDLPHNTGYCHTTFSSDPVKAPIDQTELEWREAYKRQNSL